MSKLNEHLTTLNNVFGVNAAVITTRQGRIIEESPLAPHERTFSQAYEGSSRLGHLIGILDERAKQTIIATSRQGKYIVSKINTAAYLCLSVDPDALTSVILQAVKSHKPMISPLLDDVHEQASKKSVIQHIHPGRWERPVPKDIPNLAGPKRSMW